MDVVYPYVKSQSSELEWSLTSLKNIKHNKVYVIGDKPGIQGCTHVEYIPTQVGRMGAYNNQIAKYKQSLEFISEEVMLMNDDFFIMKPIKPKNYNRGTIDDHLAWRNKADSYQTSLERTRSHLEALGLPTVDFELHIPFFTTKNHLSIAIDEIAPHFRKNIQLRTYIGNRFNYESEFMEDVKSIDDFGGRTFLSTNEQTFTTGAIGEYIRNAL